MQKLLRFVIMIVNILFYAMLSFAVEDTQVLPKGVRSFMFKQGFVGNVANRFGNDQSLYNLDSRLSKSFDSAEILKVHPRAPELIETLNQALPQQYQLGNQIQLGQLRFSGSAEVTYSAPVLAYGVSDNWTLAIVVPFAKLDADIKVENAGQNNIQQIYDAIAKEGGLHQELDREFKSLLNIDLKETFNNYLQEKSYKSLEPNTDWNLGDIQIISKHRYYDSPRWTLLNKVLLNLPTGPEDDPNDFLDIPIFHRRSIELSQVQDFTLDRKNTIGSAVTYQWNLPDRINKRVPSYNGDYLPDLDRLENVKRDRGDAFRWETNYRTNWTSSFSTAAAYIGEVKAKDSYSGVRGYDYSLLATDSDSLYHKLELSASYSSVNSYMAKKATIPYGLSYRYSDIFSGRNIEKQIAHEITLLVFF